MVFANFFPRLYLYYYNIDYFNIIINIFYLNFLNYYFKYNLIKLININLKKYNYLI